MPILKRLELQEQTEVHNSIRDYGALNVECLVTLIQADSAAVYKSMRNSQFNL